MTRRILALALIASAFIHGVSRAVREALTFAAVALCVGLPLVVTLTTGCPLVRSGIMAVTPGVPDPSGCVAPASRCEGAVPVVCSATGRWWPATPAGAPCPYGCVMSPEGAYCAGADGGAR